MKEVAIITVDKDGDIAGIKWGNSLGLTEGEHKLYIDTPPPAETKAWPWKKSEEEAGE